MTQELTALAQQIAQNPESASSEQLLTLIQALFESSRSVKETRDFHVAINTVYLALMKYFTSVSESNEDSKG